MALPRSALKPPHIRSLPLCNRAPWAHLQLNTLSALRIFPPSISKPILSHPTRHLSTTTFSHAAVIFPPITTTSTTHPFTTQSLRTLLSALPHLLLTSLTILSALLFFRKHILAILRVSGPSMSPLLNPYLAPDFASTSTTSSCSSASSSTSTATANSSRKRSSSSSSSSRSKGNSTTTAQDWVWIDMTLPWRIAMPESVALRLWRRWRPGRETPQHITLTGESEAIAAAAAAGAEMEAGTEGVEGVGYKRGMVIAFWSPTNPDRQVVKRIIGLPGDRVVPRNDGGGVSKKTDAGARPKDTDDTAAATAAVLVPAGHVWVEGDNAEGAGKLSLDSGYYGPVSMNLILGRVRGVVWPWSRRGWVVGGEEGEEGTDWGGGRVVKGDGRGEVVRVYRRADG